MWALYRRPPRAFVWVTNNTFRDNGIYDIHLGYDANNNTVAGNRVINTTSPGLDAPGQGIVVANVANRNEIVDNYVRESERFGIAIHLGNHTRVANNTVPDSGRHGITEVTISRRTRSPVMTSSPP